MIMWSHLNLPMPDTKSLRLVKLDFKRYCASFFDESDAFQDSFPHAVTAILYLETFLRVPSFLFSRLTRYTDFFCSPSDVTCVKP